MSKTGASSIGSLMVRTASPFLFLPSILERQFARPIEVAHAQRHHLEERDDAAHERDIEKWSAFENRVEGFDARLNFTVGAAHGGANVGWPTHHHAFDERLPAQLKLWFGHGKRGQLSGISFQEGNFSVHRQSRPTPDN